MGSVLYTLSLTCQKHTREEVSNQGHCWAVSVRCTNLGFNTIKIAWEKSGTWVKKTVACKTQGNFRTSVAGGGRGRTPEGLEDRQNRKKGGSWVPKAWGSERSALLQACQRPGGTNPSDLATDRPHGVVTVISTAHHKSSLILNHREKHTSDIIKRKKKEKRKSVRMGMKK